MPDIVPNALHVPKHLIFSTQTFEADTNIILILRKLMNVDVTLTQTSQIQ